MSDSAPEATAWRGHVIVMFADLCDYTSFGEASDPEDVEQLRRGVEALATSIIQAHLGAVTQVYGDGILAVFGFPVRREDDARRAVDAALSLHRAVSAARWPEAEASGFEVRMHTGLHCGLVLVRHGDAVHGKYELTGDVVNTAARLCSAAARDQIVVSAAVLSGIEPFFEAEQVPDLTLKGKKLKVPAFRVARRSDVQTRSEARSRRGLTGFVGREAVLEPLGQAIRQAVQGRMLRCTALTGAAGIGKSRVLEELRARHESAGLWTLLGSCESYGEMVPLAPFRQPLRQLFGLKASLSREDEAIAREAWLATLGLDSQEDAAALEAFFAREVKAPVEPTGGTLIELLSRVIGALSRRKPLLLMLDDWQWADDASRAVLDNILEQQKDQPICVIVGMRTLDFDDRLANRVNVIALAPFSSEESALVIRGLRPREYHLGGALAIHQRAGGHPLFLEELCRSLPESAFGDEQMLERSGAPTTLQGVIQARLSSLPPQQAQALCSASVIGIEFSVELLRQVVQGDKLGELLEDLTHNDLIYPCEGHELYRFKHGITRDVVYESVLLAERKRTHGVIAHALEQLSDGQPEALAYHYWGSGDHERAAHFAEQAGDKALLSSALDRARHHYAMALRSLERLTISSSVKQRWLDISMRWAQACIYNPARDQIDLLQRAVQYATELGETGAQAQTQYSLGWIQYVLGDASEAVQSYRSALQLATAARAERLVAQLWANLGQSYAAAGDHQQALDYLTRSIEHKRSRENTSRVAQGFSYALACRASVHSYVGQLADAERDIEEALAMVRGTGHAVEGSVLALTAMLELQRGEWEACLGVATQARAVAERVNSAYVLGTSSTYEAYARWKLTGSRDALERLRHAVTWLADQGLGLFASLGHACLADALVDAGDAVAGEQAARLALARTAHGDALGEVMAHRTLVRVHAAHAALAEAEASLEQALRCAEQRSPRELALTQLLAAELARSDPERSRALALKASAAFERMGLRRYHASAAQLLSGLTDRT